MAKLNAASALAAGAADRELLAFNMALIHMRFGQWKQALNVFNTLNQVPIGAGVGPGAALYFRARCHLEIGEKDRAMALLREAAMIDGQALADDGNSVAALAKLRLSALGEAPKVPVVR
jgi:tetratricopeptide (TPR) repeat protein